MDIFKKYDLKKRFKIFDLDINSHFLKFNTVWKNISISTMLVHQVLAYEFLIFKNKATKTKNKKHQTGLLV
jgi:hypothetical protein